MRILLIDSDISELKVLKGYVASFYKDCEIIEFSDSKNAYDFIEAEDNTIDICYTEVMMPGVTGFQIANQIKKKNKKIQVVFLSASAEYAIDAWQHHAVDYLVKPITLDGVEHTVISCRQK